MSNETERDARQTLTGQRWSRKPRRAVLLQDGLARYLITFSGLGSIVAVMLVGLFLVWVVLPLFTSTDIEPDRPVLGNVDGPAILSEGVDAYVSMAWSLLDDGSFLVRNLADGAILERRPCPYPEPPVAVALSSHATVGAFGFADGSVATVNLDFETDFLADADVPEAYRDLGVGERRPWSAGLLERTPEGQLRHQVLRVQEDEPAPVGQGPILALDLSNTPAGPVIVAVDSTGRLHDIKVTYRKNLLTGKQTAKIRNQQVDLHAQGIDLTTALAHLFVDDTGNQVVLAWSDGRAAVLRRDTDRVFQLTETIDLVPEDGVELTAMAYVAGRVSLAVGDSRGRALVWFPVPDAKGRNHQLKPIHDLGQGPAAVTAFGASARSRLLAMGYADGSVALQHVTAGRHIGTSTSDVGPIRQVIIAPREDQLLATGPGGTGTWRIDAPHPEISLRIIAEPVWYEGYPAPTYVWQSSAASDTHEPKLSLVPLIFGTLKATFYSMLFGLPLALLAAIYTSEFLSRRVRARIKPGIETMASLPSVVLGFLAALVVAPFVENVVVEVLTVLASGPFFVLLAAHLWQLLPRNAATRLESWRPIGIFAAIVLGMIIAWQTAPHVEQSFFGGDFKGWLSGYAGTGAPGWFFLLLVPCGLLAGWLNMIYGEGLIRDRSARWSRSGLALLDLLRFLLVTLATVAFTGLLAWLLSTTGWDPRGGVMDTYVQRNALIVGIAMGFAIIPIIYTIGEDALSAVPDHLRAASLGAGATPWQTAIKVVVPPAMSGLFSAAMVGLGRAVGETMIVLMAAGNTPIMDMNIFNGFRTLAANLAVELPEAVQNSTHYRTLFLAALTLFAMTFVLNTVVEVVRQRYRRKTSQL